jgi:hypothetical protein
MYNLIRVFSCEGVSCTVLLYRLPIPRIAHISSAL